jgi:hypothetical protein
MTGPATGMPPGSWLARPGIHRRNFSFGLKEEYPTRAAQSMIVLLPIRSRSYRYRP